MLPPKIIFLDAVGTLFGVRGTVGEIYSGFAQAAGVAVDPRSPQSSVFCQFPGGAAGGVSRRGSGGVAEI